MEWYTGEWVGTVNRKERVLVHRGVGTWSESDIGHMPCTYGRVVLGVGNG